LQKVLELDSQNPVAHLLLGRLAYARNDLKQSGEQWQRCLESPVTRQQANNHMAELSRRLNQNSQADRFQERAAASPADQRWPDPWLEECLQQRVGLAALFRRAEQLQAQGHYVEAIPFLREVVARAPNYNACVGLGKYLPMQGDLPGAERALRQAVELDPNGVQARYYLSRVLWAEAEQARKTGADEKAQKLLEASVEEARLTIAQKQDHGLAHLALGIALRQLHRNKDAIASLRTAVACSPDLVDTYLNLGEALADDGQKEEARKVFEQGLPLAKPGDDRLKEALTKLQAK
jgi:tetratricopeptide (TPR) repeat protein